MKCAPKSSYQGPCRLVMLCGFGRFKSSCCLLLGAALTLKDIIRQCWTSGLRRATVGSPIQFKGISLQITGCIEIMFFPPSHGVVAKFKGIEFRSAVCYRPERSAHVILPFGTGQSWPPGRMPLGMDMLRMLEKMINPSIHDITCAGAIHREFSYDFDGFHMILYGFHMVFVIFKACGANWECSTITESNIVELADAISKDGAISRFAKGSQ